MRFWRSSFLPRWGGANSTPLNPSVGYEGPHRKEGKGNTGGKKKRKKRNGRDARKHPKEMSGYGLALDRDNAGDQDLKYFAVVWHCETELLLVERIKSSTRRHRLLFLDARLAVHQVHLHVRRYHTRTHSQPIATCRPKITEINR